MTREFRQTVLILHDHNKANTPKLKHIQKTVHNSSKTVTTLVKQFTTLVLFTVAIKMKNSEL